MTDDERKKLDTLIYRVGSGDMSALDGIYAFCAKRMTAVALYVVGSRPAAEDVVSDSFVKIVRFAKKYRADDPLAWILRIVRNTALDSLRKSKRDAADDIDGFSLVDERYDPDRHDDALALESAIDRLPPDEKRAITLRYFADMTIRDVAEAMTLPRSTAERLLVRAQENLKKLLE